MFLKFKKIDNRKKAIESIRILEDTTNKYIAATNRRVYIKERVQ